MFEHMSAARDENGRLCDEYGNPIEEQEPENDGSEDEE